MNKDVAALTFAAWKIRSCLLHLKRRCLVYVQFCVDFLRIYGIEVNSLAVWSKRVKKFKGTLIISWGKQEQARTCSVSIKIYRGSVNLWLCDWRDYYLLNVFSSGIIKVFDSKGLINTLKGITTAMECVDLATFTFATWQIRSCLLCRFISLRANLFSFPSISRIFSQKKWIVELCYWSEFRDRKKNEIFAS